MRPSDFQLRSNLDKNPLLEVSIKSPRGLWVKITTTSPKGRWVNVALVDGQQLFDPSHQPMQSVNPNLENIIPIAITTYCFSMDPWRNPFVNLISVWHRCCATQCTLVQAVCTTVSNSIQVPLVVQDASSVHIKTQMHKVWVAMEFCVQL